MTYTPDGKYIVAVTGTQHLILVDAATLTLVPGWNIDLRPFGILDSRAVEFIDGQLFVSDGYDFRAPDDPMKYAVFVFDVVNGPPNATFTATPPSGPAPLAVQFTDTTVRTGHRPGVELRRRVTDVDGDQPVAHLRRARPVHGVADGDEREREHHRDAGRSPS